VVTAVPGRTVAGGVGEAPGFELRRVGGVAAARPVDVVVVDVGMVVVVLGDSVAVLGPPAVTTSDVRVDVVVGAVVSALAGRQPGRTRTARSDPASTGQGRSGRRIMRRDKHFHSVATTLGGH
jgi:hypothetical protein